MSRETVGGNAMLLPENYCMFELSWLSIFVLNILTIFILPARIDLIINKEICLEIILPIKMYRFSVHLETIFKDSGLTVY
jgi:hypothetical protein